MAKLSTKQRKKLPKSVFGIPSKAPGHGSYPMPDASHAANAKARATQAVEAGRMSPSTKAAIDTKANRVLGHSRPTPRPDAFTQARKTMDRMNRMRMRGR